MEIDVQKEAEKIGWNYENSNMKFTTTSEVILSSKLLNSMEKMGYMIVDEKFNRMAVISSQFKALAFLSEENEDATNVALMVDILSCNDNSEFLEFFPQWKILYDKINTKFQQLNEAIIQHLPFILQIKNPKDAAEESKKYTFGGTLLAMRNRNITNPKEFWRTITSDLMNFIVVKSFPGFSDSLESTLVVKQQERT